MTCRSLSSCLLHALFGNVHGAVKDLARGAVDASGDDLAVLLVGDDFHRAVGLADQLYGSLSVM